MLGGSFFASDPRELPPRLSRWSFGRIHCSMATWRCLQHSWSRVARCFANDGTSVIKRAVHKLTTIDYFGSVLHTC
jgi:hypothetical protein